MQFGQKQASNVQVLLREGTRASQTQKVLWMVSQVETQSKAHLRLTKHYQEECDLLAGPETYTLEQMG